VSNPRNTDPFIVSVPGETASKSNSRQRVLIHGVSRYIKSKKALIYSKNFCILCPIRDVLYTEDVVVGIKMFYRTRRPDLDETLVLDLLQDKAYVNDRQVKARFALWGLDKNNPRVEIFVAPLSMTQDAVKYILALD
jgi:Holliday junction resolvase RusA-like endonuclease